MTDITRSRQFLSGPQIYFVKIDKVGVIGGSFWDIPVSLPAPCNVFFICSIRGGDEANSFILYFTALNKPRGADIQVNMLGTEGGIFYMNMGDAGLPGGPIYRTVLRFRQPVQNFFVAIGSENGNLSRYTLACAQDDAIQITGGLYT